MNRVTGYFADVRPCSLCGEEACRHNNGDIARFQHFLKQVPKDKLEALSSLPVEDDETKDQ